MKDFRGEMRMNDIIEVVGKGSIIQHGKLNDRIYLMKLDERDIDIVLSEISMLANNNKYSKIFCKIPKYIAPIFFANGYLLEAYIPKFYNNLNDVFFVSKFLNSDRLLNIEKEQLLGLYKQLSVKPVENKNLKRKTSAYSARKLLKSDIDQITDIYKQVFETYPFPIHNPEYILKTMEENVQYFGAEKDGELAALSSAEIDFKGGNAEMTDFATHFSHTGNNLSKMLLRTMEQEMKEQGITVLYTIARLNSFPMNKTFIQNGYQYSGTLIKNTNIAGKIESMNVYHKYI